MHGERSLSSDRRMEADSLVNNNHHGGVRIHLTPYGPTVIAEMLDWMSRHGCCSLHRRSRSRLSNLTQMRGRQAYTSHFSAYRGPLKLC